MGRLIRQNRLFGNRVEIPIGLNEPQPHTARDFGLRLTQLLGQPAQVGVNRQVIGVEGQRICPVTHPKLQDPIAFDRVKTIPQHQRLQRGPRLANLGNRIAAHIAEQRGGIEMHHTRAAANLAHDRGQRPRRGAPVQPVAPAVILSIAPEIDIIGEEGKRPRVPCPDKSARHIKHRRAIFLRDRIMRRIAPVVRDRAQILHLHQIVPCAGGIMRQGAFRAFQIEELVGLVRPFVDGRAAVFREPDRFRHRLPFRWSRLPLPADTGVVRALPPLAQVFVAVHPRLIMRAIADRRADLRVAGLGRMVVPVIALAAFDVGFQIADIIDRGPVLAVQMPLLIAPIGQRHVVVDPDEINLRVGP